MSALTNPQRVLILGGSGQVGRATAHAVIQRRGSVILVGRDADKPTKAADNIGQAVASFILNPAITGADLDVDSGERKGTWSGT